MHLLPVVSSSVGELVNNMLRGPVKEMKELYCSGSSQCGQNPGKASCEPAVWKQC